MGSAGAPLADDPLVVFFEDVGVAVTIPALVGHALLALLYGYLPVLLIFTIYGLPAVFISTGFIAMAAMLAAGLARHQLAEAAREKFVARCARFMVAMWAAAILAWIVESFGLKAIDRPYALMPQAEWLLAPLRALWTHFMAFSMDRVQFRLLVAGGMLLAVSALVHAFKFRPTAFVGGMMFLAGAWMLGEASWAYAAARYLTSDPQPELIAALKANPGLYNAHTAALWFGGWWFLATGTLMLCAGILCWSPVRRFIGGPWKVQDHEHT